MILSRTLAASAVFCALAVVACGSDPGSAFPGDGNGINGGNGDGGAPGFVGTGDAGGDGSSLDNCASSTATPKPIPVDLVVMFDKSGSMGQSSKWTSCKQGLTGFFADPKSAGLSASLQFFPQNNNECTTTSYSTPSVSMRPLPNSKDFANAMNANSPGGGTPTHPALQGALQYAADQQQQNVGTKAAVVLVTDGEPNDCSSSVNNVSAAAAAMAGSVPTFVIGIGNTANLDTIAKAGGTGQATIVSTNNPQQTSQDFEKALDAIRGLTLACEYAIPAPPNGETLDPNKVNVVFTPTNASPQTLTYNESCNGGSGWHYDDPTNPSKIILCGTTCDAVQKDKSGKVDIVFGCVTNGKVN